MAMINDQRPLRLSLFGLPAGQKQGQSDLHSALPFSHPDGAQVARQRCPILHLGIPILLPVLVG